MTSSILCRYFSWKSCTRKVLKVKHKQSLPASTQQKNRKFNIELPSLNVTSFPRKQAKINEYFQENPLKKDSSSLNDDDDVFYIHIFFIRFFPFVDNGYLFKKEYQIAEAFDG